MAQPMFLPELFPLLPALAKKGLSTDKPSVCWAAKWTLMITDSSLPPKNPMSKIPLPSPHIHTLNCSELLEALL